MKSQLIQQDRVIKLRRPVLLAQRALTRETIAVFVLSAVIIGIALLKNYSISFLPHPHQLSKP